MFVDTIIFWRLLEFKSAQLKNLIWNYYRRSQGEMKDKRERWVGLKEIRGNFLYPCRAHGILI